MAKTLFTWLVGLVLLALLWAVVRLDDQSGPGANVAWITLGAGLLLGLGLRMAKRGAAARRRKLRLGARSARRS